MLRVLDLQLGDPAFSLSALGFSDAKSTGFLLVSRTSGLTCMFRGCFEFLFADARRTGRKIPSVK
jgi:hypothetical protein